MPVWRAHPPTPVRTDRNLYSMVLLDVAGSGRRDHRALRLMRDELYRLLAEIADDNGLDLDTIPIEDTGDGMRLIIGLDLVRPTRVVDMFVIGLAAGLRETQRRLGATERIRLRAAFDLGLIERHQRSWTGEPLVRLARLVRAGALRRALRAHPEVNLVALVSNAMYESVVQQRFGLIPLACFHEVRVRVKEFTGRAWLLAPRTTWVCAPCGGECSETCADLPAAV